MRFAPLGDAAIAVDFGLSPAGVAPGRLHSLTRALQQNPPPGAVDVVPAYGTVTVFYDDGEGSDFATRCAAIESRGGLMVGASDDVEVWVEIPVCYDAELAPDLARVAAQAQCAEAEVAALHAAGEYRVQAVGFSPGFPYLAGLPERLHTARLATPRTAVPAGSVGIGGAQTGIYPLATPGGWNLIGRTPLRLFDLAANPPARLRVGDRVRFKAITREEFAAWK
ncbi:MAG TPA: 5-oxoprolinase subunit PxpB [Opitutaceae bacterium]|nr:5-oxoprolinase subunit PxpB [Opitutaceae bacterium]HRJ45992.1 5-oxoprolinase subunit PxpB [Opitutaceae bacterium]